MSRRNNLLYFRELKVGTLDLTPAPAAAMQRLLQSGNNDPGVPLNDLVPNESRVQGAASLAEIAARAHSNVEERGLETLFLALGFASWTALDGGRDTAAPVLLMPLQATQAAGRRGTWSLKCSGELKANDVLVHALHEEHALSVDGDALVEAVLGDDEGEEFNLTPAFDALTAAAARVPGFTIARRWTVGNFAFQKMAIVKDLQQLGDALAEHDIVAGIAGDTGASDRARGDRTSIDPVQFDRTPPDHEFLILDADSSQQQAVAATLRRQNGVISGPPGTGKSQTIANLIAETVARGQTVLFVAEKRAALDVVLDRLKKADLGHLCLDCHGAELTRRHIAEQLQESIDRVRDATQPDAEALHRACVERRDRLNAHVQALHSIRKPGGLSVYQLYGRILESPDVESTTRFPRRVLDGLDENSIDDCVQKTRGLASLAPLVLRDSPSPWNRARITSGDQLREAVDAVRHLARETWPTWQAAFSALVAECPVRAPEHASDIAPLLDILSGIQETLRDNRESLFQADLARLQEILSPAASFLSGVLAVLFNAGYREGLRAVRQQHTGAALSAKRALELVGRVFDQRVKWEQLRADPSAVPRAWPHLRAAVAAWTAIQQDLRVLAPVFPERDLGTAAIADLGAWLGALALDTTTPAQLLRVHELETSLKERGLTPFLMDLRAQKPASEAWASLLRNAWLRSCLDEIQLQDPALPAFRGNLQGEIAEEFRELDRQRLAVARLRVNRAHAVAAVDARNRHSEQSTLVGREAAKRARHLPLRRLFAEAPDVLLALRPCWMASPLSVSQLIPGERPLFDLVLFDEASQVLPEDAVTSLLRGRQAVIAGDSRQLPPTTFFAAGIDGADRDDADDGTRGFQSILDVMSAFLEPAWSLDWHYRSRDEALIAFSNHEIYKDRLVTFPGPGLTKAVTHVLVPHVPGEGGQEASASREVQRVVELILDHAATRPDESLGVITMGIEHANRISMALARARDDHAELDGFFDVKNGERFFVKNLERVQGDERDAIILSIGYGKNEAGDLVYRFGPLLQEGGERRLNVAITRARRRMTVVSSFSHEDMRPDYPRLGVRLLRGFLESAAAEGKRLGRGSATDVPLNEFEQSVLDELSRHGLNLVGQVGSSRYRIDMVAMHPTKPGRFVLAIECDGASYHSAPTARDRDRLRQQQLEALGWRFHRIWSTDWFLRREDEIHRALKAFAAAVEHADAIDNHAEPIEPASEQQPLAPSLALPSRARDPRPPVLPGKDIDEYSPRELQSLVRWVLSDGRLPTDDEIITELARDLGFHRKGSRIVAALSAAISAAKRQASSSR